jgi:hypothetical protein
MPAPGGADGTAPGYPRTSHDLVPACEEAFPKLEAAFVAAGLLRPVSSWTEAAPGAGSDPGNDHPAQHDLSMCGVHPFDVASEGKLTRAGPLRLSSPLPLGWRKGHPFCSERPRQPAATGGEFDPDPNGVLRCSSEVRTSARVPPCGRSPVSYPNTRGDGAHGRDAVASDLLGPDAGGLWSARRNPMAATALPAPKTDLGPPRSTTLADHRASRGPRRVPATRESGPRIKAWAAVSGAEAATAACP